MDYSFIDLNKKLSSVENLSSVQLVVDGVNLDTTFRDNYRTLFVNGRNNMSRSINTLSFSSSNVGGGQRTKSKIFGITNRFISSTLESRDLEVSFLIKAESNTKFRQVSQVILSYLNRENAKISFTDDKDFYYIGTFVDVSFDDETSNSVKGVCKISLVDPFKYSNTIYYVNIGNNGAYTVDKRYPYHILNFTFTPKANNFTLKNVTKGYKILLSSCASGDMVTMSLDDISQGGNSLLPYLDLSSDYENFFNIDKDDVFSFENVDSIKIAAQERYL